MTFEKSPSIRSTSDRPEPLDRVGAGPVPPLAGGEVGSTSPRSSSRNVTASGRPPSARPRPRCRSRCRAATSAAEHLVGPPGERLEPLRGPRPRRPALPSSAPSSDDLGVDPEDERPVARPARAASPARALRRAFSTTSSRGIALASAPRRPGRRPRTRRRARRGSRAAAATRRRGSARHRVAAPGTRSRSRARPTRRSRSRGRG